MLKRLMLSAAVVAVPAIASVGRSATAASPVAITANPHFVKMDEIVVPIVDGERLDGRLTFDVAVVTSDELGAKRVSTSLPELRATALASGIEFSRLQASALSPVDAEQLAVVLTKSITQQHPDVEAVLILRVRASAG